MVKVEFKMRITFIVLLILLLFHSDNNAANWIKVAQAKGYIVYFDAESVNLNKETFLIKVLTKKEYSKEAAKEFTNKFLKLGVPPGKWADFSYVISYDEFNYKNMKWRFLKGINYTNTGEKIAEIPNLSLEWSDIIHGSIIEIELKEIMRDNKIN